MRIWAERIAVALAVSMALALASLAFLKACL